jgi:DNA polymerase I
MFARHRDLLRRLPLRDLGEDAALALPPEEQYLVATGRTYFRDLGVRRSSRGCSSTSRPPGSTRRREPHLPDRGARPRTGARRTLEADGEGDAGEADLIRGSWRRRGARAIPT